MKEDDKRKRKVVAFKPVTTVSERLKTYTTTWLGDDGLMHTTVHDGSFSPSPEPPGPTPYTPEPWLRATGGENGGQVAFAATQDLHLETSTDLENWSPLAMTSNETYASEIIELDENEVVYVRASQSNTIGNEGFIMIGCDNCYLDGNAYALVGPNAEDWETLVPLNISPFSLQGVGPLHIPDLPAYILPDGGNYSSFLNGIISHSSCNVSDDGSNFNFYIGVTAEDCYEEGIIYAPMNYFLAEFMGNSTGFELENTIRFVTAKDLSRPKNVEELGTVDTNGTVYGSYIVFDNIENAYVSLSFYLAIYGGEVSYDEGKTWNSITITANPYSVPGIANGAIYSFSTK